MRKLLVILGIPIDDLTMAEAVERLCHFVDVGRTTGKTHQVATVNADFVVKSLKDPELRYLLQDADMATADGMPLVWGARLLGVPLEDRVTGADMVPALAREAARRGFSIYLFGAGPGVADQAAEVLQERSPGLKVVGTMSPPYSTVLDMDRSILEEIRRAEPDILLVALGNPKQEKWIGMYGQELGVPVMIGVGGTLDFIAGKTKRAPRWMQRMGIEWIYRLAQEPRRLWKRYVVDLVGFSSFFLRQWWVMRRGSQPSTLLPGTETVMVDHTAILNPRGRLDLESYDSFFKQASLALAETNYLVINLADVSFLDSAAIGTLVGVTKRARDAGGEVWLANVPEPIERTIGMLRLDSFFVTTDSVDSGLAAQKEHLEPQQRRHTAGDWNIFRMPARMDATTSPEVILECEALLEKNPNLVLDLTGTVFLASAGLAAMAHLNRVAQKHGGEVRIAGCSADVRRVIEMVRFDRVFSLHGDVTSAIV